MEIDKEYLRKLKRAEGIDDLVRMSGDINWIMDFVDTLPDLKKKLFDYHKNEYFERCGMYHGTLSIFTGYDYAYQELLDRYTELK